MVSEVRGSDFGIKMLSFLGVAELNSSDKDSPVEDRIVEFDLE